MRTEQEAKAIFERALAQIEGASLREWARENEGAFVKYAQAMADPALTGPALCVRLALKILCEGIGL